MKHRIPMLALVAAFALSTLAFAQTSPDTRKKAGPATGTDKVKAEKPAGEKPGMPAHPALLAETLTQRIEKAGSLKTFAELLKISELDKTLDGPGEFTVFAPNDAAFKRLPADSLYALKANTARLADILKNHIVAGQKISRKELVKMKGQTLKTENGADLAIGGGKGRMMIGHAGMMGVFMPASNGSIIEIDAVLLPGMTGSPSGEKINHSKNIPEHDKTSAKPERPSHEKKPEKQEEKLH